jgi:hypothetical protein
VSQIWQDCQGWERIAPLHETAVRIVESQEQIATTELVNTLDEQHVLEQLLETTKPALPQGADAYDYLISTPFRYPPLPYGSRFGQRLQSGIYYGSLTIDTALAECAYYRFVFWSGMAVPPPGARLTTAHTTFEVQVAAARGIALDAKPFNQHTAVISDPAQYGASQQLGSTMREAGVEAFTFHSARDAEAGSNIGVFTLSAIQSRKPVNLRQWICTTTGEAVSFIEVHANRQPYSFSLSGFLVNSILPVPAC